MKVKKLIAKLSKMDPDLDVCLEVFWDDMNYHADVSGVEPGYFDDEMEENLWTYDIRKVKDKDITRRVVVLSGSVGFGDD